MIFLVGLSSSSGPPHSLTFTQPACLLSFPPEPFGSPAPHIPATSHASQLEGSRLPSFWSIRKRGPFGPPASRSTHTAAPAGVVFSSNTFIPPLPELRCALTSIFVAYLHKRQRHCLSMPAGCNYAERHSYLTAGWNCGRQKHCFHLKSDCFIKGSGGSSVTTSLDLEYSLSFSACI